jgi:hypothetical protein
VTTPIGAEGLPSSIGTRLSQRPEVFASDVARFLTDVRSRSEAGVANRRAVDGLRWSAVWREGMNDLSELIGERS